jgi:hypothetical protein
MGVTIIPAGFAGPPLFPICLRPRSKMTIFDKILIPSHLLMTLKFDFIFGKEKLIIAR